MKYACGVVLYHPDNQNIDLLLKLKSSFDFFLVYDNTGNSYSKKIEKESNQFYHSGCNDGLAKPYNLFIEYCIEHDIDVLCILDQDTMLTVENIINIKKYIEQNYSERVAIYAPRLKDTKSENWVINSNSFLNIAVLKRECLRYDEFYFLDRLDADFCMQVRQKDLSIDIIEDIVVEHKIGLGDRREHSPMRHYYMFRNRIYYNRKFFSLFNALFLTILQDIRHVWMILKNESNKREKIKAAVKGRKDYLKKRGEYCNENV